MHVYIHIYIHLYTCIYVSIFSFNMLYYYRAIYIRMIKKIYLSFCYVFIYVCLYIYICLYLYVCIYVTNIGTKKYNSIIPLQVLCHLQSSSIYIFLFSLHTRKNIIKNIHQTPPAKSIFYFLTFMII